MMHRIGLIGHGRWGANIEKTLRSLDDVELVVIEKGAASPSGLDGVCIATPSATHAQIALPFIEKGIATFIEKPMTTSVADAERLQAAALKSGTLVHVGHIHLYNPAFLKLIEILPQIGGVKSILCEGMNDNPRMDSSVLWDWLPHDLSMVLQIFGKEPGSVEACALGGQLATSAIAKYQFGSATLLSLMSWQSPVKRKLMTIGGEKGTLIFDDTAEKKLTLTVGEDIFYPDYGKDMPLTLELRAFVDAITQKPSSTTSLESGVRIVKLIAAAEEAARSGKAQPIKL